MSKTDTICWVLNLILLSFVLFVHVSFYFPFSTVSALPLHVSFFSAWLVSVQMAHFYCIPPPLCFSFAPCPPPPPPPPPRCDSSSHLFLLLNSRAQTSVWNVFTSKTGPTAWRNAPTGCKAPTASFSNTPRPTTSVIPATPTAPRGKRRTVHEDCSHISEDSSISFFCLTASCCCTPQDVDPTFQDVKKGNCIYPWGAKPINY